MLEQQDMIPLEGNRWLLYRHCRTHFKYIHGIVTIPAIGFYITQTLQNCYIKIP
jgi:hypothetical protein